MDLKIPLVPPFEKEGVYPVHSANQFYSRQIYAPKVLVQSAKLNQRRDDKRKWGQAPSSRSEKRSKKKWVDT